MALQSMSNLGTVAATGAPGAIRLRYAFLLALGVVVALVVLAVVASAVSNIGLPTQSTVVERLSEVDKARLAEYLRLQAQMMGEVWPAGGGRPAWGEVRIPAIVHNEAYAFLVGYPGEPPDGWVKVPQGEHRGGAWEAVPGDDVLGGPYYRQRLPSTGETPENFTVLVGDVWVATLATTEYAAIDFYRGFRRDLPGFLQPIFPYRLMWALLMGPTENYLGGLAHEAFHAYQGTVAEARLASAESLHGVGQQYPWDLAREAWEEELQVLYDAAQAAHAEATPEPEVRALAQRWLAQRAARREAQGLTPAQVEYERQREWLEGLAKYAEITLGPVTQAAVEAGTYRPLDALEEDDDFHGYRARERHWAQQLTEVKRMAGREDTRFYYMGFAEGVVLDRLMPDWKARAMDEGVWLEGLVAEAVE